ncbi:MAG: hypothetical protein SynsKO_38510 [Synoicihabitans sp.]
MPRSPNILIFVTDQQRADTIARLGNPIIRTPVLDRLSAEGVTFTRAYSPSPVCVPARCALATGQHPAQSECWDNMDMPNTASYMEILQRQGFQTHGIGKMHFMPDHEKMWGFESRDISEEGKPGDFINHVRAAGFGHVLAPHGLRSEHYYAPQPSQLPAHLHESHWVADRSIDFLQKRDRNRPFLLNCHFIKPHPPFENPTPWSYIYRTDEMPPPYVPENCDDFLTRVNQLQNRFKYKDRSRFDDLGWRTLKAAYYGAISFIDYQVGRVLEALGDELDNTLVIFTSDHGEMMGDYGCAGKRCMLEASARIPLIARLPRGELAGKRVSTAVSLIDIFPTVTQLGGASAESTGETPGSSLVDIAHGAEPDRVVFSQFQAKWMGHYMATDGRTKFVHSAADQKSWTYSIDEDLTEQNLDLDAGRSMESAALEHFGQFPATEAVENGTWKKHDVPAWPSDPNYGLLRQDPDGLDEMLAQIGPYAPPANENAEDGLKAIFDHQPK